MYFLCANLTALEPRAHSYSCDCASCRDCQPWWEEPSIAAELERERLAGPRVLAWLQVLMALAVLSVIVAVCWWDG